AFITGDTTDLAAMSEEGCVFCRSTIDDATKLHKDGGWANPWTQKITNIEYIPPGKGKEYCGVKMVVISDKSTSVEGNGRIVEEDSNTKTLLIALRRIDEDWVIGGVAVE
ncbi:DUF6318 family protein, partial [Actinomyces gaoshouyii]|uniref:DUF6318 family protein n=1 Tax=Actinomyces gaoshouyii TaxID=1960083 RepID=UPI00357171FC